LDVLTIHAVSWTVDRFNEVRECGCDQTVLFKRFTTIMEEKPLVAIETLELNLNLDEDIDIGVVIHELEDCTRYPISFTGNWGDHFQHNSLGSIKDLVYTHEQ
jgi:hypothetical protein